MMAEQASQKSVEVESISLLQQKFEDSVMNYKMSKQKAPTSIVTSLILKKVAIEENNIVFH